MRDEEKGALSVRMRPGEGFVLCARECVKEGESGCVVDVASVLEGMGAGRERKRNASVCVLGERVIHSLGECVHVPWGNVWSVHHQF